MQDPATENAQLRKLVAGLQSLLDQTPGMPWHQMKDGTDNQYLVAARLVVRYDPRAKEALEAL